MNENEEIKTIIQLIGNLYTCVERAFRFQVLEYEKIGLLTNLFLQKIKEE